MLGFSGDVANDVSMHQPLLPLKRLVVVVVVLASLFHDDNTYVTVIWIY